MYIYCLRSLGRKEQLSWRSYGYSSVHWKCMLRRSYVPHFSTTTRKFLTHQMRYFAILLLERPSVKGIGISAELFSWFCYFDISLVRINKVFDIYTSFYQFPWLYVRTHEFVFFFGWCELKCHARPLLLVTSPLSPLRFLLKKNFKVAHDLQNSQI